jgi:hypothetical protein
LCDAIGMSEGEDEGRPNLGVIGQRNRM